MTRNIFKKITFQLISKKQSLKSDMRIFIEQKKKNKKKKKNQEEGKTKTC